MECINVNFNIIKYNKKLEFVFGHTIFAKHKELVEIGFMARFPDQILNKKLLSLDMRAELLIILAIAGFL